MTTAKAIQHADINGKLLYYLQISNGTDVVNINVGHTTYEKVLNLNIDKPVANEPELPFEEQQQDRGESTTEQTMENNSEIRRYRNGRTNK